MIDSIKQLLQQEAQDTHHQLYEKIISNMQEVKSRNGRILAVVTEGDQQVRK